MAVHKTTAPGAPCRLDLSSSDPEQAKEFYAGVFGWTAQDMGPEFGSYVNFYKNDIHIAGMMNNQTSAGRPDAWTVYLYSADIAVTAAAVPAAGGTMMVDPMDVMGLGTMAVAADPGGAGIGIWQPGTFEGFGLVVEAGTPAWFELHTRRYADAVQFYREAFGWDCRTVSDDDHFRYTTLGQGQDQQAGIMDMERARFNRHEPSSWNVYIGCDDVDGTVARTLELGGGVVEYAEDSPFGRLAKISDPAGARIKLVSLG